MTPSIDLRISTILGAMQDVIIPAVDPLNSLAQEQSALVVGHLKLLAYQWSRMERYASICLADLVQSTSALEPDGGELTISAGRAFRDAISTGDGISSEAHYKGLMKLLDVLMRAADADGTVSFRNRLRSCLLAFSRRQTRRDRSWFALSGFDLKPGELLSLDEMASEQTA